MTLEGSLTDFGNLATNPNSGDTVNTGDTFVVDLWVHAQDHPASAEQTYVTYTYQLADLADVRAMTTTQACVLTQAALAGPVALWGCRILPPGAPLPAAVQGPGRPIPRRSMPRRGCRTVI